MPDLRLAVDLGGLDKALLEAIRPDYSQVGRAMDFAGAAIASAWESAAYGVRLPGMTRTVNWPEYARTIEHHNRGEFEVVIKGDDAMTERATEPRPAWDMKPGLLKGRPFVRIPFRHKAESVSDAAMQALIANVRNFRTELGRRSKLGIPVGGGHYTWTTGPESGIRITNRGEIMTFRTVSQKSPAESWWYPALPANPLLDAVWEAVRDEVEAAVFEGWVRALGLD